MSDPLEGRHLAWLLSIRICQLPSLWSFRKMSLYDLPVPELHISTVFIKQAQRAVHSLSIIYTTSKPYNLDGTITFNNKQLNLNNHKHACTHTNKQSTKHLTRSSGSHHNALHFSSRKKFVYKELLRFPMTARLSVAAMNCTLLYVVVNVCTEG